MTRESRPAAPATALDGLAWHKSTYSGADNGCVEHAATPAGTAAVRDTKDRRRGTLLFSAATWTRFLRATV
ncbi:MULTISPECIES: DUF397 domain-containing protein [unclassified Streptomyces]|uniref:DUF397 domain-containing protein n=1 Tax=Streptomyces evansiae TaxID=3075535 RepID=A0ABD5E6J0_9ACTN|nr:MULTISPECIES: DUF397 domain-containing protein [unclassified Streptomyces]ASY34087.1 DUF397 domain-containing protein [Streptomyces sp. CLI2509]EGJ76354.1 hypothetical protein STTU_3564 [Streptomyces sp. Tu6071]MDT0416915.1 DUF397 domain-containing protein [Streptomyces sp. DSM 41982]MYX22727.1 DUF397 domain-containing protein [Streptomyces sp. SID8380]